MSKKRILVAVTGMSPQIVTETLYALVTQKKWVPHEIHVLTTLVGGRKIEETLLGEKGYFQQFCREYELQEQPQFTQQSIHIICDNNGQQLSDIRSVQDNDSAADMIVRFIHDLCLEDNHELHVSIAGGRKSMGFYIGYALSLFGRKEDILSHVLVSEPFESSRDFFYPAKESRLITLNNGEQKDMSQAQVILAEIPFVRIRDGKPKLNLDDTWNYRQAVEATQNILLENFNLDIDLETRTIRCGDTQPIQLQAQPFSLYAAFAKLAEQKRKVCKDNADDMNILINEYIDIYGKCRNKTVIELSNLRKNLNNDEMQRILQENSARISRDLRKELGDHHHHYCIKSEGSNHKKSYFLATTLKIRWLPQ